MVEFPLGLQCRYMKLPCFLCLWDSRAKAQHWIKDNLACERRIGTWREKCSSSSSFMVEGSKIVFLPLHIKLGIMKQFVKALNKDGGCFRYISIKFPGS